MQAGYVKPLLAGYRKKLMVGAIVLVPACSMLLLPGIVSRISGYDELMVAIVGALLFAISLYAMARGARCPSCRKDLFWYSFQNAKHGNWLVWLLNETACPHCGYRHEAHGR